MKSIHLLRTFVVLLACHTVYGITIHEELRALPSESYIERAIIDDYAGSPFRPNTLILDRIHAPDDEKPTRVPYGSYSYYVFDASHYSIRKNATTSMEAFVDFLEKQGETIVAIHEAISQVTVAADIYTPFELFNKRLKYKPYPGYVDSVVVQGPLFYFPDPPSLPTHVSPFWNDPHWMLGWRMSSWMGLLNDYHFDLPNIYTQDFGWFHLADHQRAEGWDYLWIYVYGKGYRWTAQLFYPWCWNPTTQAWEQL